MQTAKGMKQEIFAARATAGPRAKGHDPIANPSLTRIGAVAALVGAVVFLSSTLLHPSSSAPNDLAAAFAEYAGSPWWVAIHLGQFA